MPLLTVLMSAYNAERYIKAAINSILGQSFRDFEFIIFDDGSSDSTAELVRDCAARDGRIVTIYNESNSGYSGFIRNLNKGIELAQGEYIARMDADDIALRNRFAVQCKYLKENPDISLVGTSINIIDEDGTFINKKILPADPASKLTEQNCIFHPTIMFRRKSRLFYRDKMLYCEDYDLYLRMLSSGMKLINLSDVLLDYRVGNNSVSRSKASLQQAFSRIARDFYLQRTQGGGYDSYNLLIPDAIEVDPEGKNELYTEIKAMSYANNYRQVRLLCASYTSKYGFRMNVILYGLLAMLPERLVRFLKLFKN